ncbi:PEP-CTERM sorting domain-containing protein [Paraglaciecola sp.]|uniref:PEP-CTERM sorting domain-containing protein n=1 Tax=Paraglaciecola sp. TaxID=1920173 RepID=UPI0030F37474
MVGKICYGALFLVMSASASAAMILTNWQESNIAEKVTEFSNEAVYLQKFNTLGNTRKLLAVEFDFFGALDSNGTLTNTADGIGTLRRFSVESTFQLLFGANEVGLLTIAAPYDIPFGGKQFAKGQVITFAGDDLKANNQITWVYNSGHAMLANFIGSGPLNLFVNSITETVIGKTGGNFVDSLDTFASAGIKVRYGYEELSTSVPEPGTFVLLSLALAGIGFNVHQRKYLKPIPIQTNAVD